MVHFVQRLTSHGQGKGQGTILGILEITKSKPNKIQTHFNVLSLTQN